jgi:uncharacterized integral membrane protein (TIGR00698 family)
MNIDRALRPNRQPTALEQNLLGVDIRNAHQLLPGVIVAALLALCATWLSQAIGVGILGFASSPLSSVTVAVLLGLLVGNVFRLPARLKPGLTFAVKKLLRLGIILLGIRLSLLDVAQLGASGLPVVLLCIASALLITAQVGRWLDLSPRLATLIAVGTSICGVSAIVATAGAIDADEEEVAYAVATITLFGLLATFLYPYLAHALFGGDPVRAGLFMGTAIHDTSQVTGAAMIYAETFALPQGLDAATVTKLVRNLFMAAAIPCMALSYRRRESEQAAADAPRFSLTQWLPLFIIGFLALAALRTVGDGGLAAGGRALGLLDAAGWRLLHSGAGRWAASLLTVALAAVGLSTRLEVFKGLGLKPLLAGFGAALTVGIISVLGIVLVGATLGY